MSPLVLRARITKVAELDPKKVTGIRKGWARIYVEAVTNDLLTGPAAVGEALAYFGLDDARPTLLVFGGSQGARRLNDMVVAFAADLIAAMAAQAPQ